jgi:hypothetical protein
MTRKYTLSEAALEQRRNAGSISSEKKADAGSLGGSVRSRAKRRSARENGKLGGRPRKNADV